MIETQPLDLDEAQEAALLAAVQAELNTAIEVHTQREQRFADFLRAYKAQPKHEKKDFPWPDASNVVVPLVATTVDAIVARLQKAMMGTKDFVEVIIKAPEWEGMEKDIRDWANIFVETGGLKGRLRTLSSDMALYGDGFILPIWVEDKKTYHKYNDSGDIVAIDVPGYTGTRWFIASPSDVIYPNGFDEWGQLPWKALRLRHTWAELKQKELAGEYEDVARLKATASERQDPAWRARAESTNTSAGSAKQITLYQIMGLWEIPGREASGDAPAVDPAFEEVILVYSVEANCFVKKIYNPFFGKPHHLVKVPFLNQAHEVQAMGAAEQTMPFQEEASTAHNQKIDAATASNAGLVVVSTEANFGDEEEIYPGKKIVTPNPDKDVRVYHLNEPGPAIQNIEDQAAFLAEKRSGMSSYNLGMESGIVGSRATATGTTALISEGNIRQWVSIDDMRDALAELLYLTIQLEQQFRPEGIKLPSGKMLKFPPGDVRTSIGLTLKVTSEQVNRDLELQNLQILMTVLNDYYTRLSSASMMMFNPQIPPEAKLTAFQIMVASQNIVKRFVERFDVENVDMIVPNIVDILKGVMGGQPGMAGAPAPGPQGVPAGPGGGPAAAGAEIPPGGVAGGAPIAAGGSSLPA